MKLTVHNPSVVVDNAGRLNGAIESCICSYGFADPLRFYIHKYLSTENGSTGRPLLATLVTCVSLVRFSGIKPLPLYGTTYAFTSDDYRRRREK